MNETHRAVAQCIVYVCCTGCGAVLWVKRFSCVLCVCLWTGRCGGPRGRNLRKFARSSAENVDDRAIRSQYCVCFKVSIKGCEIMTQISTHVKVSVVNYCVPLSFTSNVPSFGQRKVYARYLGDLQIDSFKPFSLWFKVLNNCDTAQRKATLFR